MYQLRDKTTVADPRLGRLKEFDERSRNFRIAVEKKPRSYRWRCSEYLDQGSDGACHIQGTEILTDSGWKLFENINSTDKLATVEPKTNKLEFQAPTNLVSYRYKGDIHSVDGRNTKFHVTPDHRMYVRKWNEKYRTLSSDYSFVQMKSIGWYCGLLPAPSPDETKEDATAVFTVGNHTVDFDTMAKFIGLFLSEGCLYHHVDSGSYRVEIAKGNRNIADRERILDCVGFKFTNYWDRFTINNKALFDLLTPFYNGGSLHKWVPDFIKNSSNKQIRLFIDSFSLGDAHITKSGRKFLYTSSKRMAGDFQELFLRLGIRSRVVCRPPRDAHIGGRLISKDNVSDSYVISPWKKESLSIERKSDVSIYQYDGMVYCATVPNSTLITRFDGVILISGNCVGFAITHELIARPSEVQNLDADYAKKAIYWEAQRTDQWDGGSYPGATPKYEGTSVLAGVKVAQKLGWFDEYRWGFGLEDLVLGVGHNGPAVLGIPWYEGMMKTGDYGAIHATGKVVGGHAILCKAVDVKRKEFTLHNSWGRNWGLFGECVISFTDMTKLLHEDGEVVFFKKRHRKIV